MLTVPHNKKKSDRRNYQDADALNVKTGKDATLISVFLIEYYWTSYLDEFLIEEYRIT